MGSQNPSLQDKDWDRDVEDGNARHEAHLIAAWRALQLTNSPGTLFTTLSKTRGKRSLHAYIPHFVRLARENNAWLDEENQKIAKSYEEWAAAKGVPHPEPKIRVRGEGRSFRFIWPAMQVAFADRWVPAGWRLLIDACICWRSGRRDAAQTMLAHALAANENLAQVVEDFVPISWPVIPAPRAERRSKPAIVVRNWGVGLGNFALVLVSVRRLAQLAGRDFVVDWSTDFSQRLAFELAPDAWTLEKYVESFGLHDFRSLSYWHYGSVRQIREVMEVLLCQEPLPSETVHFSTQQYFLPFIDRKMPYAVAFRDTMKPSAAATSLARRFMKMWGWREGAQVIGVHVRALDPSEDNDDWPASGVPN